MDKSEKSCVDKALAFKKSQGRSMVKKVVMAYMYGAMSKSLIRFLRKEFPDWTQVTYRSLGKLVDSINTVVQGIGVVMALFQDLPNVEFGSTISLPEGFDISLVYHRMEVIDLTVSYPFQAKYHLKRELPIKKIDVQKRKRAMFVNLIHGLDALHMTMMLRSTPVKFLPLHDCIIFHIGDYDLLKDLPRDTYSKMYSDGKMLPSILASLKPCTGAERGKQLKAMHKLTQIAGGASCITPRRGCFKLAFP